MILDAGCGSGIDTLTYLEGGASQILSFDPSEFILTKARESIPSSQVIFRLGAYEHIPFEETCADILVGRFSLHYVANIDAGYKEIVRTLKPGGKIAFLIPHSADDFARRKDNTRAQEIITISLYDEKVSVYYPSHTFSNYFSEYFLRHFTLVEFAEFTPDEMGEQKHPTACVFGATKK